MMLRYVASIPLVALMIGLSVYLAIPQPRIDHPSSGQAITESTPSKGRFHGLTIKLVSFGRDKVPEDLVSELLLTDPQGRRTGRNPKVKVEYEEIPRSSYGQGDADAPMQALDIPEPLDGLYLLQVIGTAIGPYSLYLFPWDENGDSPNQPHLDDTPTVPGMVHLYTLDYTRTPGVLMKVWGGFDGGGETPSDVNEFLTYANPIAAQTTLRPGKTPFPLIIFYGAAIDPASFTATLNGANISRRFKPIPGRYQVVPLKFALGSNTLILSVRGKTAGGQTATDADQFGFSVR